MPSEKAPWWGRVSTTLWRCKSNDGRKTAEVRQVDENRYVWGAEVCGDEIAGTSTRCIDAMRAAERAMGYERQGGKESE